MLYSLICKRLAKLNIIVIHFSMQLYHNHVSSLSIIIYMYVNFVALGISPIGTLVDLSTKTYSLMEKRLFKSPVYACKVNSFGEPYVGTLSQQYNLNRFENPPPDVFSKLA